jgi:hypothetical protein
MPDGLGRFLYEHGLSSAGLWDITYGSNIQPCHCYHTRRYLAFAQIGCDGPTGVGSPDGIAAF